MITSKPKRLKFVPTPHSFNPFPHIAYLLLLLCASSSVRLALALEITCSPYQNDVYATLPNLTIFTVENIFFYNMWFRFTTKVLKKKNSLPKFLSILRLKSDVKTILTLLCRCGIGLFVARTNRNWKRLKINLTLEGSCIISLQYIYIPTRYTM